MKVRVTLILVITLVLLGQVQLAWPQSYFANESYDLNDNQVPDGWTLQAYGCCGGLVDGHLEAQIVDAHYGLRRTGQLEPGTESITLEWDGNLAYSYWGIITGVQVFFGSHQLNFTSGMSRYNAATVYGGDGMTHLVTVYGDSYEWRYPNTAIYAGTFPLVYGNYRYTVTLTAGTAQFKGVSLSDGSTKFDVTITDPGANLDLLTSVEFRAYTTTDNNSWVDNISIEVTGGEEPSPGDQVCDEFDGTSINTSLWNPVSGTWSQSEGRLTGYWPLSNAQGEQANILWRDSYQSEEYTFEVDMVMMPGDNNRWGISLYHSPGNRFGIGYDHQNGLVAANIKRNGGYYESYGYSVANIDYFNTALYSINHAKVVRSGKNFTFFLNGRELFTLVDNEWDGDLTIGVAAYGYASYEGACFTPGGGQPPEDQIGPEVTEFEFLRVDFGMFGNPPQNYVFSIRVSDLNTGGSNIDEVEFYCGNTRIPVVVEGNSTEVFRQVPIPILSSLEKGDHILSLRAKDHCGNWGNSKTMQITIRRNDFDPVRDGFHFENWGLLAHCTGMSLASIYYKLTGYDLDGANDNNINCANCNCINCSQSGCEVPPLTSPMRWFIEAFQYDFFLDGVLCNALARINTALGNYSSFLDGEFTSIKNRLYSNQYPVIILAGGGWGGHAVVGYATVEIGDKFRCIHVYDPNYPRGTSTKCVEQAAPILLKKENQNWCANYEINQQYNLFAELYTPNTAIDPIYRGLQIADVTGNIAIQAAHSTYDFSQELLKATQRGMQGLFGWIRIESPVSVMLIDNNGLRVGFLDNTLINEITGAEAKKLGTIFEDFFVPADRTYRVVCTGTGEGVLHQSIYFPNTDSTMNSSYFEFQISTGIVTETGIHLTPTCPAMQVDADGDGEFESVETPLTCELQWVIPDTVFTCNAVASPWYTSWINYPSAKVKCYIGDLPEGYTASDIVPSSIQLNGAVPPLENQFQIIAEIEGFTGPVLEVSFDACAALQSLGEVSVGEEQLVLLSGRVTDDNMFFAQALVSMEEGPGFASLSGFVTADSSQGLLGINVDIYDSFGVLWQSVVTDDSGYYHIDSIPNGDYTISVVTPLGYQADQETKEFTIHHVPVQVDFTLSELDIAPNPRSRAYWAHQLHKALQNKPRDYTVAQFAQFAGLINQHFNQNLLNPVDFYTVPQPADQQDSLVALKKLLNLMPCGQDEPFLQRLGKGQLMALMLNVVSGKIHQTQSISPDSITVSQVVTYCDMLLNDEIDPPDDGGPGCGSPWIRYIRADFILTFINLGLKVPAGLIPPDIINIAYRYHQQTEPTVPETFTLYQNFPNPFNPYTEIGFDLPAPCDVKLEVFNIMGQKVATLVDQGFSSGHHSIQWDASQQASGVYFYKITAGDIVETKKMVLLK